MKCSRPNCPGSVDQRGLCQKHYDAWIAENPTVPAEIVAAHIHTLRAGGMNGVHIAELSGVDHTTIYKISSGRRVFVQGPIAQKILAVQLAPALERPVGWVPIVGVARRLQALIVMGYTTQELADRTGYGVQGMPELIHAQQPWVKVATARAVDRVYRELMFTPAPETLATKRARLRAQRAGWWPALVWDDIDDPDEKPESKYLWRNNRVVTFSERYADVVEIGVHGDANIAERLGISPDSLKQMRRRLEKSA